MKILFLTLFCIGVARGHLLEGVPATLTITYKSGHSVTLTTENDQLTKIEVILNGEPITVGQEELLGISDPNLRSVRIFETDLDKVKKYHIEFLFGNPPDIHGSIEDESTGDTVRFYFVEGRYASRVITMALSRDDQLGLKPAKQYVKLPGNAETPPNRIENNKENKAEMATPRKPSD